MCPQCGEIPWEAVRGVAKSLVRKVNKGELTRKDLDMCLEIGVLYPKHVLEVVDELLKKGG